MHGKIVLFSNKKIIRNAIRENEMMDEELIRKASNKFFTPYEFNHALKDLLENMHFICI